MKKNYIKIILDILMAITFVLLMSPRVLNGLPFHEIAGLAIGVAVLAHIGLNFNWVIQTTKKIFSSKLPIKTRMGYVLNILLLISMSAIIITGILISKYVFPNLTLQENHSIKGLHGFFADATLALLGLHVALHWQWVMNICKRAFVSKSGNIRKGVLVSVILSLVILAGGIQWVSTTFPASNQKFEQRGLPNFNQGQNVGNGQEIRNGQPPINNGESFKFDSTRQGPPNGEFRGKEGHGGSNNPFLVMLQYFGIWTAIIVPFYYLEKYFRKNRNLKIS